MYWDNEQNMAIKLTLNFLKERTREVVQGEVLLEAMASKKPLIGSNVRGIPMQIRNGWNGFLVKPRNEKQLAERTKYLVEDEIEKENDRKNSRKLAEEKFNEKIA